MGRLISPAVTLVIWLAVDRALMFVHKNTHFALGYFVRNVSDENRRNEVLQRVKTFRSLIFQAARFLLGIFFFLTLLYNIGVDPRPLLAGVGVAGLAISLAAQNILRDFINGLLIVAEDQFNVGDWIEIAGYSGTVEDFGLRATKLRALDGRMIIVPNSAVVQVVNYTKTWAVSTVEIGIAYNSDVSQVVRVLESCCADLMSLFPGKIIESPNIQSIVDFRPNDMLVRVLTKTQAGEQWAVGRALRRLIKDAFDKAGIEIQIPQIIVHDGDKRSMTKEAAPGESNFSNDSQG